MHSAIRYFSMFLLGITALLLTACSENYSNGERIGFITKFSDRGIVWKSWEGELNLTQTGMNTSSTFQFSVDNDNEDPNVVKMLDSAAVHGWKIKLRYHETFGFNWLHNRGETDLFVTEIEVLDRNPLRMLGGSSESNTNNHGIRDTIYIMERKTHPSECGCDVSDKR